MEKKFELTDEVIIGNLGVAMHRIRCTRAFAGIKRGDLGGFVEKEANLSHYGNAWVYGNARVYNNARVYGNALVCDNAEVSGNALVSVNALVCGNAEVSGNAWVYGNALVYGNAHVCGNARVSGNAFIGSDDDHCGFDCFGSQNRHTHAYTIIDGGIEISCGCFRGNIEEFERQVRETHGDNEFARQYQAIVNLVKIKFGIL